MFILELEKIYGEDLPDVLTKGVVTPQDTNVDGASIETYEVPDRIKPKEYKPNLTGDGIKEEEKEVRLFVNPKSGKEKPLGDMLGFQETIDFLHLDKIEEPKDEKDYNAYLKRNTHLVMGGVNVPPKSIKECLGVNDLGDAEDNFEVVTDERLIKDRDEKKYTTGKVVYIYAINKGERKFIGVKSFRPKQGQTSKTNNDIKWSKEMQTCFDSKRDK